MSAFQIRPADAARDAAACAAIYAPSVRDTAISFEVTPPTATEMGQRIAAISADFPWLVAEEKTDLASGSASAGALLGYVYASRHRERAAYRWAADATVYVAARHQRRGVGRALYTSLFALLRLQGFYQACAGITLPNPGSVALHESLGFRPVGIYRDIGYKTGAWHPVGWWQLALQPPPAQPPPEPLKPPALRAHPAFRAALGAGLPLLRG